MVAIADPERPNRTQAYPIRPDLLTTHKTSRLQPPLVLLLDILLASPTRLSLLCVPQVPDHFPPTVTARWMLTDLVAVALSTADSRRYAFRAAGEEMALAARP